MARALIWIFGTALAAAIVTFAIGMFLPQIAPISQHEGAYAMGIAFVWTPAAFVLGAILGLVLWRTRRRS